MRDADPVKARLARVLFYLGVVVLPFLGVWIHSGFAAAMGMVFMLVLSGVGLLILAAILNKGLGWLACYVFTGEFPKGDFEDWFDDSVLDQWEHFQNKKAAAAPRPHVTPAAPSYRAPEPPKQDDGPDWLRKS